MTGNKSGLEHHMPEQPSPTTDGAFPAHGSTVMCNGRKACERCGLLACDLAKLGRFGDQHRAGHQANTGNGPQDTYGRCERLICVDVHLVGNEYQANRG